MDWRRVIELLRQVGYESIMCCHPEYEDEARAAESVAKDREYVKGLIG